jgi:hypothetical protein
MRAAIVGFPATEVKDWESATGRDRFKGGDLGGGRQAWSGFTCGLDRDVRGIFGRKKKSVLNAGQVV